MRAAVEQQSEEAEKIVRDIRRATRRTMQLGDLDRERYVQYTRRGSTTRAWCAASRKLLASKISLCWLCKHGT